MGDYSNLTSKEKQLEAVLLRKRNYTYREIGEELDISHTQARRYVTKALSQLSEELNVSTEEYRILQLERLNLMARGLWSNAESGNAQAIASMLKLMEQELKLIGLDVPKNNKDIKVSTRNEEIANRLRREMGGY